MTWHALHDTERSILRFEEQHPHWKFQAVKDAEVFDRWHMSPTRYAQVLDALIDKPAAEAYSPMTVRRLRRLREKRRAARTAGFGAEF